MLGDLVYESKGKVTGQRVLELNPPKIESSYSVAGKLKGIAITEMGTYTSTMRPDGTMWGEDKSITMAEDGSVTTATARGIGRLVGPEKISFRGFATMAADGTGKLAAFNSMLIAFEVEVDGENIVLKGWEWK
ncbi:MAG TPA: hypothetical protein VGQ03_10825 [Nitrososphaera sp.]|jgi:hypothetical protein|nr:hypothetical protein [Nitrososphaera sp.]